MEKRISFTTWIKSWKDIDLESLRFLGSIFTTLGGVFIIILLPYILNNGFWYFLSVPLGLAIVLLSVYWQFGYKEDSGEE